MNSSAITIQTLLRHRNSFRSAVAFFILALVWPSFAQGRTQDAPHLTGKNLNSALKMAVSVNWQHSKVRDGLIAFGKRQKIAILVDRRADAGQLLNFNALNVTPEQFLWKVAAQTQNSVCRVGDLFVFGNENTSHHLPLVLEASKKQLNKIPIERRTIWNSKAALSWPRLSEPRGVLLALAEKHSMTITNPEKIPHDLWPAYDLPPVSLHNRFGILCSFFGCWMKINKDGKTLTIIDQPPIKSGTRKFKMVSGDARKTAKSMRNELPEGCKISDLGKTVQINGTPDDIAFVLEKIVAQMTPEVVPLSNQRLSLDLAGKGVSRMAVLKKVAEQIDCELVIETEDKNALKEDCEIKLDNQPVEVVIRAILLGSNLQFRIENGQLVIFGP